ncbi:MAG: hypothetical protein KBE42_13775 [Steroidobacteraceae bacterium]|nr:hypothetical protein [Steroidobacteraceae bacterium]
MRTRLAVIVTAAAVAWAAPAAAQAPATTTASQAAPAHELRLSNKWRIEVSEGANNDGTILFRVTPKDGAPVDVSVAIKDGRGEDGVARDIRDAFKATLDSKEYHAEVDDGEDVLVKKHHGSDFELKLVESTIKGTRLDIEKE